VAAVAEVLDLRAAGVDRPIVVCSPAPIGEIDAAVEADLQLSVSSLDALRRIADAARRAGRVAGWHLEIDTGMGRSGFDWRCTDEWFAEVTRTDPSLRLVGCYTHLHSADEGADSVETQWERLESVLDRLYAPPEGLMVHVLNSAGVFRAPQHASALVRPGIFLYGGCVGAGQPSPEPVASVRARVVHTREVPPGTTLGYGATHTARGVERWATLSIGYGDGLPRALSNRGSALLRGVRTPIVGRISMDVTVVDCSGASDVTEGDVATLIGVDEAERITVDEVATQAGTISYEILTGLTKRLPRVWQ